MTKNLCKTCTKETEKCDFAKYAQGDKVEVCSGYSDINKAVK